jgi:hypothetical protein
MGWDGQGTTLNVLNSLNRKRVEAVERVADGPNGNVQNPNSANQKDFSETPLDSSCALNVRCNQQHNVLQLPRTFFYLLKPASVLGAAGLFA